jgi:hypothetical protein
VQLAAEFTSAAAPRTVLQAAKTTLPPITAATINLRTILLLPRLTYGTTMAAQPRLCPAAAIQQLPPFIVFSVQFATEFTSRAAPRTVLHAAVTMAAPISATVRIF